VWLRIVERTHQIDCAPIVKPEHLESPECPVTDCFSMAFSIGLQIQNSAVLSWLRRFAQERHRVSVFPRLDEVGDQMGEILTIGADADDGVANCVHERIYLRADGAEMSSFDDDLVGMKSYLNALLPFPKSGPALVKQGQSGPGTL